MLEFAWGLRKILSGKMKSNLGSRSKSRMLEVASGKKRSRSKSEMLHTWQESSFLWTFFTFPEIQADARNFNLPDQHKNMSKESRVGARKGDDMFE
jgi:hypothetical protein